MARGGQKPAEIMSQIGASDEGDEQGGCGCPDFGTDLLGGGPLCHDVWVVDVVDDPHNWKGFGRITPQGGPQTYGETTSAR